MSRFHIGQRVVCIYRAGRIIEGGIEFPQFGEIYTIRAFCPFAGPPAILLSEIVNNRPVFFPISNTVGEPSWLEKHFRPLQDLRELFKLDETVKPKEPVA